MRKHSFVWTLGLTASMSFAQQTETTQEIEDFFDNRAETLQQHLSVPLTDQAFHKRFIEAYKPLDKGRIPAQWRDALVQRMLALAGVSAANLSAAQLAQVTNSVNVLGSAGANSTQSAAALAALGNALGISSDAAGNALASAAGDTGLFNGNTSISQSFVNNSNSARDKFAAQASNPNSLTMAKITPPTQVKYENEGAVTSVSSITLPNPSGLTMGGYASQLGQSPGSAAKTGSTGVQDSSINRTPKPSAHADLLQQALIQGSKALATTNKTQTPTPAPRTNNYPDYANNLPSHVEAPVMQEKVNAATTATPATTSPSTTKSDPFKYDPSVLLGGWYADEARTRVEKAFNAPSSPNSAEQQPGMSGPTSSSPPPAVPKAGTALAESNMQKALQQHEVSCEETLAATLKKDYGVNVPKEQVAGAAVTLTPELSKAIDEHIKSLRISQGQEAAKAFYNGYRPSDTLRSKKNEELTTEDLVSLFEDKVIEGTAFYNGLLNTNQTACAMNKDTFALPRSPHQTACEEFSSGSITSMNLVDTMKLKSVIALYGQLNFKRTVPADVPLADGDSVSVWQRLQQKGKVDQLFLGENAPFPKIVQYENDTDPVRIGIHMQNAELGKVFAAANFDLKNKDGRKKIRWMLQLRSYMTKCPYSEKSWGSKIIELEYHAMRAKSDLCGSETLDKEQTLPGLEPGYYATDPYDCKKPHTANRTDKKMESYKDPTLVLNMLGIPGPQAKDFDRAAACVRLKEYQKTFEVLAQQISKEACQPVRQGTRVEHKEGSK
ncbi:MAG: hypothetical protein ABIR96_05980 [Bdellovibrionota bacterium]